MKKKYYKIYKLNQLQKIKQTYKYIYIFRYNDLKINEIISFKKYIKKINYDFLITNQNLINNFFLNIKGQGPILIIYGNSNINLIEKISILKKIELIYIYIYKNIYSSLKINKLILHSNNFFNILIFKPFLIFLYYLRKITKRRI